MKIKFIMLFVAAMIYNYVIVAAQTKQNTDNNITGHVIDAKTGEHLPYVSISIKGTTIGMVTDATGHYFLKNIPEQDFTLEASYVGYQSQEIPVKALGGKTIEVNFTLKDRILPVISSGNQTPALFSIFIELLNIPIQLNMNIK